MYSVYDEVINDNYYSYNMSQPWYSKFKTEASVWVMYTAQLGESIFSFRSFILWTLTGKKMGHAPCNYFWIMDQPCYQWTSLFIDATQCFAGKELINNVDIGNLCWWNECHHARL